MSRVRLLPDQGGHRLGGVSVHALDDDIPRRDPGRVEEANAANAKINAARRLDRLEALLGATPDPSESASEFLEWALRLKYS